MADQCRKFAGLSTIFRPWEDLASIFAILTVFSSGAKAQTPGNPIETCLSEKEVTAGYTCRVISDEDITTAMNEEGRLRITQTPYKCVRRLPAPNQIYCAEVTYDRCSFIRTPIRIRKVIAGQSGSADYFSSTTCMVLESAKRPPQEATPASNRQ
jgi:hypothetical protein